MSNLPAWVATAPSRAQPAPQRHIHFPTRASECAVVAVYIDHKCTTGAIRRELDVTKWRDRRRKGEGSRARGAGNRCRPRLVSPQTPGGGTRHRHSCPAQAPPSPQTDTVQRSRPRIRRSPSVTARDVAAKRTGVRGGAGVDAEVCPVEVCEPRLWPILRAEWHRISTPAARTGDRHHGAIDSVTACQAAGDQKGKRIGIDWVRRRRIWRPAAQRPLPLLVWSTR
jgi:hypothetical protein